jgi:signal transduction histidine kinase/ActR/RegA family two-component response regulator
MNSAAGISVVPASLWWPLLSAAALPLVFGALALAGWPSRALASRLAVRTACVLSLGFALLVSFASLTVFHGGIEELGERPPEGLAQLGDDISQALQTAGDPVERVVPRLVLAQSADSRLRFVAVVRLECGDNCLIASTPNLGAAGDAPVGDLLEVLRTAQRGVTRIPAKLGGSSALLMLGAVRNGQGTPVAVVVLGLDASTVADRASQLAWQMLGVVVLLLVVTSVLARQGYASTVADRVRAIIDTLAARRGEGEEWASTPGRGTTSGRQDELQVLTERVDGWIERSLADHRQRDAQLRALEAQLTQAQKMEAIGRLSGGIAHDFNNLLTVIRANAQLLDGKDTLGERRAIDAAAARGAALVRKLLAFSRADVLAPRALPVAELIGGITDVLRRVLPESISLELPETLPHIAAVADPTAFEQMLLNIVVNARDAMPSGGQISINVTSRRADAAPVGTFELAPGHDYVIVSVQDSGIGMSPEVMARVFEPFFTTKPPESGSGLGLAIVYGMMQQQRGAVEITSAPGAGTMVTLWFPAEAITETLRVAQPTPLSAAAIIPQSEPGRGRLLLVEDEEGVRQATERALSRLGFEVVSVEHGAAAMAVLDSAHDPVDLIVSDMMMPVMGGLELWRAIRERQWDTPILFISGYSTESITQATRGDRSAYTLSKPWTVSELGRAVRGAIGGERVTA